MMPSRYTSTRRRFRTQLGPQELNWQPIMLRGEQDAKRASIRMSTVAGGVTKGGRSPDRRRESGDRRGSARGRVFWQSRSADRKRVLHADEEPQLARPPHHRLSDEAIYEFPPNRDADHCRPGACYSLYARARARRVHVTAFTRARKGAGKEVVTMATNEKVDVVAWGSVYAGLQGDSGPPTGALRPVGIS
jgi:hypothetical protein